jgi:hypothetical protein
MVRVTVPVRESEADAVATAARFAADIANELPAFVPD